MCFLCVQFLQHLFKAELKMSESFAMNIFLKSVVL